MNIRTSRNNLSPFPMLCTAMIAGCSKTPRGLIGLSSRRYLKNGNTVWIFLLQETVTLRFSEKFPPETWLYENYRLRSKGYDSRLPDTHDLCIHVVAKVYDCGYEHLCSARFCIETSPEVRL